MNRLDKLLVVVASLLLFIASAILCAGAYGQTPMPAILNPDPNYWYGRYLQEKARADNLAKVGKLAIDGLQASLKAANDTIQQQGQVITVVVDDRNKATERAAKAEQTLHEYELDRPKTAIGRIWKGLKLGAKDGLRIGLPAFIGGVIIGKLN